MENTKSTAKVTYNENAISGLVWKCSDDEGNSGNSCTVNGAWESYKSAKAESDAA